MDARTMKREGLQRTRLEHRQARLEQHLQLGQADAAEVDRFRALLGDLERLPLPEVIELHGAAYLGFTEAEAAAIAREHQAQPLLPPTFAEAPRRTAPAAGPFADGAP